LNNNSEFIFLGGEFMEYNESNFFYLKNTSIEKYYEALIRAEHVCEYFPMVTKIIARKVIEAFLKDIAEKYDMESNVAAWQLVNNIKLSQKFSLPEEIYKYIEIILVNAYEHSSYNHKIKRISKHPIEILETAHNVFCWYLNITENQLIIPAKNLNFKAPSTIEYMQREIIRINNELILKENEINNLRQKLIEQASHSTNISDINNTIIAVKEEKAYLEKMQIILNKKIEEQKKQVLYTEKEYSTYIKKFDNLSEKCNESQELIFGKESQLVKSEIQKQEVRDLINKLEEQDDSIKRIEQDLEEELNILRKAYENLVDLIKKYEDNLETIEFSYDKDLQKILEIQQKNIMIKINFEDRIFNENIIAYSQNIVEARKRALIFKEILNDQINKEIKYEILYKGFLNLAGKELRIIYILANSINTTFNLLGKSKELPSRSIEDKFLELINRRLDELKNVNDDEIRLIIYYELIKLAEISSGKVYNRKHFIQALDGVVDNAYMFLSNKIDFNGRINKIDAIAEYYLKKIIAILKSRNSGVQIGSELVHRICKNITELRDNGENIVKKKIYYGKFDLDTMSEEMIKSAIKIHPFEFLSIMISMGSSAEYTEFYAIIFKIYNLIEKRFSFNEREETFVEGLPNEYFIILMFLSSKDDLMNEKLQEGLLPLLIMEIVNIQLILPNEIVNLESYKEMINLWKQKQHKYSDNYIEKEEKEKELKLLIQEKQMLEVNHNKLLNNYDTFTEKYRSYEEEFKNIIINSDKRVLLPSFRSYYELRNKKEVAEKNINESKDKFGAFKSMFSPGVWKEKASRFVSESNMLEAEKLLIEEAKQKPYFQKEYLVFAELEDQIEKIKKLINKSEEDVKNKNLVIENVIEKISKIDKQLNTIKDIYIDIEDVYY
jgi:hypothetical protein